MGMKRKSRDKKERSEPGKKPSLWKRLLAMALGPLVFLVLAELVLSLAGYGLPKKFFIPWEAAGQTLHLVNERYCEHFVPKSLSRAPEFCALGPKGESTIRIFVLGSSAAFGDPEPAYGFCRQLEVLLNEHAEGRSFEVVNAAVTAMNSHVARRIARDCAAQKPDLFVLFMGNNEVIGPYGPPTLPASLYSSRRFINACITVKKETRIGQLLKNLSQATSAKGQVDAKWMGMESFLASRIAADDPKLQDCYRHFRSNLDEIIRTAQGCGAGVLLCTVPINIQFCAPFGSEHKAGLTTEVLGRWNQAFQEGRTQEQAGDFTDALVAYEKARQIDDSYADLAFCRGRCLVALGKPGEGRRAFVEARDLDVLRFRADSSILRVIRETAQAWSAKGVRLLDLDADLTDRFVDHVHLDFRGNFLAAFAAMGQIREMLPLAGLAEPKGSEEELLDLCRRRLLYDEHEQYRLAMVMYRRKTIPPFLQQIDHGAELAGLRAELIRLRQVEKNVKEPESVYLDAVRQRPFDTCLILCHGQFLMETGRLREAMEMYRKSLDARPFDMRIRIALSQVLIQGNMKDEAVKVLSSRNTPDRYTRKDALLSLGTFCAQTGNIAQAAAIYDELGRMDPKNLDILVNRAAAASQRGDLPAMKQCLDRALSLNPDSVLAVTNMGNYYAKQNQPAEAQKWFIRATELDPQSPFAHIGAGIQSVRLKQMDKATEHLMQTVMLKPDVVEAYLLLAGIHDQAGRKEESKKYMDLATLFRPGPWP
jgi:tetratricopeptide (TPR) repeat protein